MEKTFTIYQIEFQKWDFEVWKNDEVIYNIQVYGEKNLENLIICLQEQGYKEIINEEFNDWNLGLKGEN